MKQLNKICSMFILQCLCVSALLQAQNFHVIDVNKSKDANPYNDMFNGEYDFAYAKFQYAVLNGISYFSADDGIHGTELWRSDGTAAGTQLVKDINPGIGGSNVHDITISGGKVFFSADDGVNGQEIWVSDGTRNGTRMRKDIFPGPGGSFPSYLMDAGGTLYFFVNYSFIADQLWKSDGTEAGTVLVADFYTPDFSFSYYGNQLTNVNGHLFFVMNGGGSFYNQGNSELWTSDGTSGGTHLVKEINPFSGSLPFGLTSLKGLIYFSADDGAGRRLWVSDGTDAGTNPVNNTNSIYLNDDAFNSVYNNFTVKDNKLFFSGYSPDNDGNELCSYNPSAAANTIEVVKDFNPGSPSHNLYNITNVNGTLFFTVYAGIGNDQTLWKSDGTTAGTVQLKDVNPGGRNVYFYKSFVNANGLLLFGFYDDAHGYELWKSNGTKAGTVRVKDINPGIYSSNAADITYIGGNTSLFQATDGNTGLELWKTNGTEAGTTLVKNINQSATASSNPAWLTPGPDKSKLFFTANDPQYGSEVWVTDASATSAKLVKDIFPGSLIGSNPSFLVSFNKTTCFFAGILDITVQNTSDAFLTTRLFKTNGTNAGTSIIQAPDLESVINGNGYIESVTAATNLFYITIYNFTTNLQELWRSDGTSAGTYAVKRDLSPYYALFPTAVGNTLFFTNYDDLNGLELWKTEGTVAFTGLVKDIFPGFSSSFPTNLVNFNGKLYFSAFNGQLPFGNTLWVSDGTDAGTKMVKPILLSFPQFAQAHGKLFFSAENAVAKGYELFTTDGTAGGTEILKDISPGAASSDVNSLISGDTLVYFLANDGTHGQELWKSNGTKEGTKLVKDITPGIDWSFLSNMVNVNDKLFFTISDILWQSDGTKDGTNPVNDAGLAGVSGISNLTADGDKLYFTGYTYTYGQELYAATVRPGASAVTFAKTNDVAVAPKINDAFAVRLLTNPFIDQLRFSVNVKDRQTAQIMIVDASGRLLKAEKQTLSPGANIIFYDTDAWAQGIYIIHIVTADGSTSLLKALK